MSGTIPDRAVFGRRRAWIGLAAVAALAAGLLLWLRGGQQVELTQPDTPTESESTDTPSPPAAAAPTDPVPAAAESRREAANPGQMTPPAQRKADFPQGLEGLVVDRNRQPMPGVAIYLLESARNEPLTLPALREQGLLMGPVAETRSGPDGTFAIGLALPSDKLFELRLIAPGHADARIGDLRVLPAEWHDIGTITMVRGTTVRGRVTVEGTPTPVPQAVVTVEAGSVFEDAVTRGIRGRENGLSVRTGSDGAYVIENAPAAGLVRISAAAAGFARVIRHDVDLSQGAAVAVDFALPPGLTIAGRLVDSSQQPVGGARVAAWSAATSVPPCVSRSRADGSFEIVGLADGDYRVRVIARGYQDLSLDDVTAGTRDLRVELQPRAAVSVRVTGDGRVVRSYRLGVRRHFPAHEQAADALGQIGRVRELPDQRVRLGRGRDRETVAGLPPGEFVVQVTADGWAKTLSPSFTITADSRVVEVDVELLRGATLRGRVATEDDVPLAGATVATQPDGARPDNPIWRMLGPMAPDRITELRVESGADGSFVLPRLARGDYQLEIHHPEACRRFVTGLAIRDSADVDLGVIRLQRGTVVFGRATTDGRVAGQVKIVLTSVFAEDAPLPQPAAADAVRLETVTDSTGAFLMPRRVPPGHYEIRAAAIDAQDPDSQVFQHLLQMQQSATRFTVAAGQSYSEQQVNVVTRR